MSYKYIRGKKSKIKNPNSKRYLPFTIFLDTLNDSIEDFCMGVGI